MPLGRGRPDAAALEAPRGLGRSLGPITDASRSDLVADTVEFLKSAAPRLTILRREIDGGPMLDLPVPDGAQYQISLFPSVPEIAARLLPPLDRAFFWYWPFRIQQYGTEEQREAEFFRCIGLILANPTRIIQRRGLVDTRFRCHALTGDGKEPIGGSVGSFLSLSVPDICGRECTYASPALLAASAASDGRQDR